MEDPLKCTYCFQRYDHDIHAPMTLNCGHSFCSQCIFEQKLQNQDLRCQKCNKIDSQAYESMNKNFTLMQMLESPQNSQQNYQSNQPQQFPRSMQQSQNYAGFQNQQFQFPNVSQSQLGHNNPFSSNSYQQTNIQQQNNYNAQMSPQHLQKQEDVENIIQDEDYFVHPVSPSNQRQSVGNQEYSPRTLQLIAEGISAEEAKQLKPYLDEEMENDKLAQEMQDEFYAQALSAKLNNPEVPQNRAQNQKLRRPNPQNNLQRQYKQQMPVQSNQQMRQQYQIEAQRKKANQTGCCHIY